jgi:exonuclease III
VGLGDLNSDNRLNLMTDALYKNVLSDILRDIGIYSRYADEGEIVNILSGLNFNQFSCISANIQGLPNNNSEFINFMNRLNSKNDKISLFALQETWLKDINFSLYYYPGYKSFFKCREPGKDRGGVGLIIQDSISCQLLNNKFFVSNILETISVKISSGNFKAIIVSLYRPPNQPGLTVAQSFERFIIYFNEFLEYLEKFNLPIIMLGDFNLNLLTLNNENSLASTVNESLLFASFIQCITRVTRLCHPSFSLIDFICLRDIIPKLTHSFVINTDLSDHFPVMCILNLSGPKRVPKQKNYY